MSNPVGWVVIARENTDQRPFIAGVLDHQYAASENAAIAKVKSRIEEDHSSWRFAAFGVARLEPVTKRNLNEALRRLGFYGLDIDQTYSDIVGYLGKSMLSN